jgi:hypothetical protein
MKTDDKITSGLFNSFLQDKHNAKFVSGEVAKRVRFRSVELKHGEGGATERELAVTLQVLVSGVTAIVTEVPKGFLSSCG